MRKFYDLAVAVPLEIAILALATPGARGKYSRIRRALLQLKKLMRHNTHHTWDIPLYYTPPHRWHILPNTKLVP